MKFWWRQIQILKKVLKHTIEERDSWKQRVDDIERRVEKQYGIKVRHETVVVNSDFEKVELAIIAAGINKLLKDSKNSDDTVFYLELRDKIQGVIDKMKEKI